jgi:hypothetical protein
VNNSLSRRAKRRGERVEGEKRSVDCVVHLFKILKELIKVAE